jgi:hypothetical protein
LPVPAAETNRISRFSRLEFRHMLRVYDSAVSGHASPLAAHPMLPSPCLNKIGTRDFDFGAQWLACVASRRCYTRDVTIASVRSEARATGWVFSVRLFHSLFQAGLSRRFLRKELLQYLGAQAGPFVSVVLDAEHRDRFRIPDLPRQILEGLVAPHKCPVPLFAHR